MVRSPPGSHARRRAAAAFAPELVPTSSPNSRLSLRVIVMASTLVRTRGQMSAVMAVSATAQGKPGRVCLSQQPATGEDPRLPSAHAYPRRPGHPRAPTLEGREGIAPWGSVIGTSDAQWLWSYDSNLPAAMKVNRETIYVRRAFFIGLDGESTSVRGVCR